MGRNTTALWTIVAFLGASLAFRSLRHATEHSGAAVTALVQVGALIVLIGVVVVLARRRR